MDNQQTILVIDDIEPNVDIPADLLNDEYDNPLHFENALYLAENKIRSISGIEKFDTTKIKSRLYNYLKNRGFTSDIIYSVFEKLKII